MGKKNPVLSSYVEAEKSEKRMIRDRKIRRDGTVILGRSMAIRLLKESGEEPHALFAVMAHEIAHLKQFKVNTEFSKTKYAELHADFLAGWIIGELQKDKTIYKRPIDEAPAFVAIYRIGDSDFTSPDHHGTKKERLEAFLGGLGGQWQSLDLAYQNGLDHVKSVEKKDTK